MNGRPDPVPLIRTATGFYQSQALFAGVELGVFARLAKGPADRAELEAALGLHPSVSRDFLDALVAMGLLAKEGTTYRATPLAAAYLDPDSPEYIGGFLTLTRRRLYPAWGELSAFLRSGQSIADRFSGGSSSPMAHLYADEQRTRAFAEGMDGYAVLIGDALAERFPWHRVSSFADLGGCRGKITTMIASAHPHLRGVTFDLAPLEPLFRELVEGSGVADRVTFQAGDFFSDRLPETEVYVMGHVLHDWPEARRRVLIERAFQHLPPGGALIIYDSMFDDERDKSTFGLLMSLNMALVSGASEYSTADGTGWLREAGFEVEPPVALNELTTMLVGWKPA